MRRGKKKTKVVWTDNNGNKPAPFAQPLPNYSYAREVPNELVPYLVVGALFMTAINLDPDVQIATKFPPLFVSYRDANKSKVPAGSFIIYTGTERIEERERSGKIISVIKHVFIAAGTRYVINDLTYVVPL